MQGGLSHQYNAIDQLILLEDHGKYLPKYNS